MKLALIAATDLQGLIGKDNDLPWHLPADLAYFKKITMGKPLIMGRKTHESIGRALPGRKNIIITRDQHYQAANCEVVFSISQALAACDQAAEVIVMGGRSLYQQLLPQADIFYLTLVHARLAGNIYFPEWSEAQWQQVSRQDHAADTHNQYAYSFIVYQKISE